MKTVLAAALILWASCAFSATTHASSTASVTSAKRADILKLIHTTGAMNLGMKLGNTLANNLIETLKRTNPNVSVQALDDIQQAVHSVVNQPSVKTKLLNDVVSIYAKNYSDADIRDMLRFYRTPLGQKIIKTTPKTAQEGLAAGEAIIRPLRGELIDRIRQNLERDHINPKTLQPYQTPPIPAS
ncbi:MAG: DUF2059 domain-containing protein [Gammaproteobacteria bacterium]